MTNSTGDQRHGMAGTHAPSEAEPGNDVRRRDSRPSNAMNDARSERLANPEVSSFAPPAAGEVGDYMDNGEASGGMPEGGSPREDPSRTDDRFQGPKTTEANRRMSHSGSPDQGTH